MRTTMLGLCLAIACVGAAGTTCARAVEIDAAELFGRLDANGDGEVDRAEAGGEHARLFSRLLRLGDEDGDGRLAAEEFAAALTPVRAEKELVDKQGSRLPGSDALLVIFAKMDGNGDRRLEPGEIPEQLRGAFTAMLKRGDADKNGSLDAREIAEAGPLLALIAQATAARLGIDVPAELAKLPPDRRRAMEAMGAMPQPGEMLADPDQAAALFARLDADGDALITADEAPEGLSRLIDRGDRNGDGKLSQREFQAMARRMAQFEATPADPAEVRRAVRQLLARFDRDADGVLDGGEAPPRLRPMFDRLDADQNGSLEGEELELAGDAMLRLQRAGRQRPQPQGAMDEEMQP